MAASLRRVPILERDFPRLKRPNSYGQTSDATPSYNCIAYAAGVTDVPWCPVRNWKKEWPRSSHFRVLEGIFYITRGYSPCDHSELEVGFEKIAVYANAMDDWTHAARQLPDGWWTSKMGNGVDITHERADDLEGVLYGTVKMFLKRPCSQRIPFNEEIARTHT